MDQATPQAPSATTTPNQGGAALHELILAESSNYANNLWMDYQLATTGYRQKLARYYKQYRGVPDRKNYQGLANVVVNETLEACESIVAQEVHAIFADPKNFMLVGRESTDERKAKMNESLLSFYQDIMGFKSKMIRHIRQKNKYGTTFGKICWEYEEKDIMSRNPQGGVQNVRKVVRNHPDIQYIDLMDIAVDPGKPAIENMDWVIIRRRYSWDAIKEMERRGLYSPAQVAKLTQRQAGSRPSTNDDNARRRNLQSVGIQYQAFQKEYEVLEFWGKAPRWWVDPDVDLQDPRANEMVQIVMDVVLNGPTLRLERNPYWHQEIPVVMGHFIQVDDEALGMGVCEITEALQMELNDKRNQLLDHATFQIFPPLLINRAANINDSEMEWKPSKKIKTDIPGDGAVTPMKIGGNPMENVQMDQIIKQDIRNQTGATNPVQGISSNKESTAFEVSTLQSRGSARIDVSTIDFGEKFLKRTYRLMYAMIQQYLDRETVVRIVGKDGIKWEKVTPEDVAGDYDIIPKIATDVDNRTVVRNQLIQFMSQIAPFYPRINVYRIAKKVYSLFGFEDVDQVVPEPDTERGQDALTFEEEIAVLGQGQKIPVNYYDNHLQEVTQLMQFLQQHGNNLTPQARAAFEEKIQQHMIYLKNLEQTMAGAQGAPGGVPAPAGAPGGVSPSPRPTNQTPVAQGAQNKRNILRT